MLLMVSGILPDKLFMVRFNILSPFMFSRDLGILPSKELLSSKSSSRTMQFPILLGICPDNWFPDRISLLRLVMVPTSGGRDPERELYDKSKNHESKGS